MNVVHSIIPFSIIYSQDISLFVHIIRMNNYLSELDFQVITDYKHYQHLLFLIPLVRE